MARVRKPRSDQELAQEETELAVERYLSDKIDQDAENRQKLAAAGEPEAKAALEALKTITRLNNGRIDPSLQAAIGLADAAADATGARVEDERDTAARNLTLDRQVRQEAFDKAEALRHLTDRQRAERLMETHWRRWARDGEKSYADACGHLRLNVGRDAVTLVKGGVFDSHLDVAQFIQRMAPTKVAAEETDWTDDLDRELKELRGED